MRSCEEGQIKQAGRFRHSKAKLFFLTVGSLFLVALVVSALTSMSVAGPPAGDAATPDKTREARSVEQPDDNPLSDDIVKPESEMPRVRSARYVKMEENATQEVNHPAQINTNPSCFSYISNTTVPAAHIKGQGMKFNPPTGSFTTPSGYQQRWKCTEDQDGPHRPPVHAFVDGGMCFNQTDKTLRVPTCGYYLVTSQVMFNVHQPIDESRTVYHVMNFKRHCTGVYNSDFQSVAVTSKASIGPFSAGSNFYTGIATTHTSDIIKLCTGGSIWLEIPSINPCCPTGDSHGTFISAVLVSETSCHWPPDTMKKYLDP